MSNDLMETLLREDDIGKVIKGHIHIEQLINHYIEFCVVDPTPLKEMRLDYYSAIHLAVSLGLPNSLLRPLKSLGKIRNSFAHNIEQKLSGNETNNLYSSLGSDDKIKVNEMMSSPTFSWTREGKSWRQEKPAMQFVVLCMHLYYSIKLFLSLIHI